MQFIRLDPVHIILNLIGEMRIPVLISRCGKTIKQFYDKAEKYHSGQLDRVKHLDADYTGSSSHLGKISLYRNNELN